MAYLSGRALKGLKNYVYKPAGYTWLDDLHAPFWNWLVNMLPMWVAPNLITLIGTSWLVLAYLVSAWHLPEFAGEAPRWVYILNGVAVILYLHLDCIDGKQARRTGSSSPLGQLFDHGCDALSVHLIVAAVAASLNLGVSYQWVVGQLCIMIPWILAHWEEYHTGLMNYGNGAFGVLEANYALVFLHFVTALFGPHIWRVPLAKLPGAGFLPSALSAASVSDGLLFLLFLASLPSGAMQLFRVLSMGHKQLPAVERGHKQLGPQNALNHILQLLVMFALGGALLLQQHGALWEGRAVAATFGITYALEASKLIMDHMSKEPFELIWWPIVLLAVLLAHNQLLLAPPAVVAGAAFAITLAGYLHYVVSVVREVGAYLGIGVLTIKRSSK